MFCQHCGNKIDQYGSQCHHCGRDLNSTNGNKRRVWPWVLLSVSLLLLATFGSCAYMVSTAIEEFEDPSTVLGKYKAEDDFMFNSFGNVLLEQLSPQANTFLTALENNDLETAYQNTTQSFKNKTDFQLFTTFITNNNLNTFTSYDLFGFTYFNKDNPYMNVHINREDSETETIYLQMKMVENEWHVTSLSLN